MFLDKNHVRSGSLLKFYFDMVKRFYYYFKGINEGEEFKIPTLFQLKDSDIVTAFFVFCHQMEEWMLSEVPINQKEIIKTEYKNHIMKTDLKYARDLCISMKHCDPESPPLSGIYPFFKEFKLQLIETDGKPAKRKCNFTLITDRGDQDAFVIATNCFHALYDFIIKIDSSISMDL